MSDQGKRQPAAISSEHGHGVGGKYSWKSKHSKSDLQCKTHWYLNTLISERPISTSCWMVKIIACHIATLACLIISID
jgi:hypothetical protein